MRHTIAIVVVFSVLACTLPAFAQNCRRSYSNRQNTKQDYLVSTTAVQVLAPNTSRCGAIISNVSVSDMRCTDVAADGVPTSVNGFLIKAGQSLSLDLEGQQAWQCIRASGTDATASVLESLP